MQILPLITVFAKLYLLAFNSVVFVFGLLGILLSALLLSDGGVSKLSVLCVICLTFAGAILMIVSSLGCNGVYNKSRHKIVIYAKCYSALIIAQLIIVVFMYALWGHFVAHIQSYIRSKWQIPSAEFDDIQSLLKCCGLEGKLDYLRYNAVLPMSCYVSDDLRFTYGGCIESTAELLYRAIEPAIFFGVALTISELLAIVCCYHLVSHSMRPINDEESIEMNTKL